VSDALRRAFDCREAYKPYGQLFLWLLQGGQPIAARAWTAAGLALGEAVPPMQTAAA
jgi:hypothetical protein